MASLIPLTSCHNIGHALELHPGDIPGISVMAGILLEQANNSTNATRQFYEESQKTKAALLQKIVDLEKRFAISEEARKKADSQYQAEEEADKNLIGKLSQESKTLTEEIAILKSKFNEVTQQSASLSKQISDLNKQIRFEAGIVMCSRGSNY